MNSVEGSNTGSLQLMIIGGKLNQGKAKWLIVLLVRIIGIEELCQDSINTFHLTIDLKM
jgi:hypothetical protein